MSGGFWIGILVAFSMGTAVECYLLLGVQQRQTNYNEQLLTAAKVLLDRTPGPSAARTAADIDQVLAQPWYPRLRLLAALRDLLRDLSARPGVTSDTTVKEALTADPVPAGPVDTETEIRADEDQRPTDTFAAVAADPATAPVERLDIAGGLRLIPPDDEQPPTPAIDDVDLQLARFGLRTVEGRPL